MPTRAPLAPPIDISVSKGLREMIQENKAPVPKQEYKFFFDILFSEYFYMLNIVLSVTVTKLSDKIV